MKQTNIRHILYFTFDYFRGLFRGFKADYPNLFFSDVNRKLPLSTPLPQPHTHTHTNTEHTLIITSDIYTVDSRYLDFGYLE